MSDEEEQPAAQPVYPSRGPDREEMVANYLPKDEEWPAKTLLELNDPAAIAALSQFGEIFPEVDDLQPIVDDFLHQFLKSRTSVSGKSRDEYKNIFQAMYGGHPDDDDGFSKFASALAGDLDDD